MFGSRLGRAVVAAAAIGYSVFCAAPSARAEIIHVGGTTFASLSGHVYGDINRSCALDVGEIVIPNVTISLTGVTKKGGSVSLTTLTSALGAYSFATLQPGTYCLTETQPVEFLQGKWDKKQTGLVNGYPVGEINGADEFRKIVLEAGGVGVKYDFGEGGLRSAYISKRDFLTLSEEPVRYVPEPGAAMLLGAGALLVLGGLRRRLG
jgi:hypothetical protein